MDAPKNIEFKSLYSLLDNADKSVNMLSEFIAIDRSEIGIIDAVWMDENLVNRLDLLCIRYYGTIDMLDLLLEYNDIVNPFDVPLGKPIFIPEKSMLQNNTKPVIVNKLIREMNTAMNVIGNTPKSQIPSSLSANFAKPQNKENNARSILKSRSNGLKYDGKTIKF